MFIIEILHAVLLVFTFIYFKIYTKNRKTLTEYIISVFKQVQHQESYQEVENDIDMKNLHPLNTVDNHLETVEIDS